MNTILRLIGLAVVIAVGYWAYHTLSTGRNEPGKLAKDAVESAKDAWRIVSGEGAQHGQKLGGSCSIGANCKGYRGPARGGNTCCKDTCATLVLDYMGVYMCPAQCKSTPGAQPGSC